MTDFPEKIKNQIEGILNTELVVIYSKNINKFLKNHTHLGSHIFSIQQAKNKLQSIKHADRYIIYPVISYAETNKSPMIYVNNDFIKLDDQSEALYL